MKKNVALLGFVSMLLTLSSSGAAEAPRNEEPKIREAIKNYIEAYNRKDADAISRLYAEDAVYTDPLSGSTLTGREAIKKYISEAFSPESHQTLELNVTSISFPKPGVAVERGVALVKENNEVESGSYVAEYKKQGDKWLLTRVEENEEEDEDESEFEPLSHYEQLKDLEFLVGKWTFDKDNAKVNISSQWDRYKNFLIHEFSVAHGDKIFDVRQRIGWDPIEKRIRSWLFDTDGGFGEGVWTKKGKDWIVTQKFTLADGKKASAVHKYSNISPNGYTWEATNREVDGVMLPNMGPFTNKK